MAVRTTASEVKSIIDTTLEDNEVDVFIGYANRLINNILSDEDYTETVLKDIETYLTAHFIATSKERQPSEQKIGDVGIKYQGKYGAFLESTSYGQMVIMLDENGKLASTGQMKVTFEAIAQYEENYDE